ncbi:hypothetical protein [Aquimarina pacifica]|uniref:hypothetical protein n=1 Tax=Aquimarina pacifica TaxID=1296415 RepID=UPI000471EF1C|nr:hypothetical protein [Aquimarina pacifica]
MKKDKSSILVSIFKRKGGEGQYTKILNDSIDKKYSDLLSSQLTNNEKGLLIYYLDSSHWFILTDLRVINNNDMYFNIIENINIKKVSLAIEEEFKDGVRNKKDFTRLLITDHENQNHLLELEKGSPYEGIYQVLHFLANQTARI